MPKINVVIRVRPRAFDAIGQKTYLKSCKPPEVSSTLPALREEEGEGIDNIECKDGSKLWIKGQCYMYQRAVVTGSSQGIMNESLALRQCLDKHHNSTVIAYGQTGSGKTYSVFGPPNCLTKHVLSDSFPTCPPSWGVFPKALFEIVTSGEFSRIQLSSVEVYGSNVYDLFNGRAPLRIGTGGGVDNERVKVLHRSRSCTLSGEKSFGSTHPSSCRCGDCWRAKQQAKKELKDLRDSGAFSRGGPSIAQRRRKALGMTFDVDFKTIGEKLVSVSTPEDIVNAASTIEATRQSEAHNLNDRSSRSHCITKVYLLKDLGNGDFRKQDLLFVDLAGSERINKTGSVGIRLKEATDINSSLTVLGRVINAINSNNPHVPYRESALTMLLRSSFEGRSKIQVLICLAVSKGAANDRFWGLTFVFDPKLCPY